jgi:asparagine synthase (glutamine-hydrolysing)
MCGILGFSVRDSGVAPSGGRFLECVQMLSHRGPDGHGAVGIRLDGYFDETICPSSSYTLGLGHTRLAILDLSANGRQPMQDEAGNWLVHNGEIYNYLELKKELAQQGCRFHTETDTEVILAAYRAWGASCVERFNGMWAFALYDSSQKLIFCSRDRLGIKPFYYIRQPGAFAFASEIRPLLHLVDRKPVVLRQRLADALVHGITDGCEQTLYQGVRQLMGGHSATFSVADREWKCWRYWSLPAEPDVQLNDDEALDRYEEILEDSVRLRLRADVPVAITLSGGIDSSAVALAASRVHNEPISSYTSCFPENPDIDETSYARQVADHCELDSQLIEPDLTRMERDEPTLCRHQEFPFGSLSLYVHWAILDSIRDRGTKVVLSGQGGDELFLGYERYFVAKVLSELPNAYRACRSLLACGRNSRLGFPGMAAYLVYFSSDRIQRFRRKQRLSRAFAPDILSAASPPQRKVPVNRRELQTQELLGEQLSHLLRYDDRTSAAHGMETRLPFLDYRLVEFAYRLPWCFKIRDGWSKWLSRKYLERYGLHDVAWRRKKLGFNAPTASWVKHLWNARGADLAANKVARRMLRKSFRAENPPASCLWDTYNILELSAEMGWDDIA